MVVTNDKKIAESGKSQETYVLIPKGDFLMIG